MTVKFSLCPSAWMGQPNRLGPRLRNTIGVAERLSPAGLNKAQACRAEARSYSPNGRHPFRRYSLAHIALVTKRGFKRPGFGFLTTEFHSCALITEKTQIQKISRKLGSVASHGRDFESLKFGVHGESRDRCFDFKSRHFSRQWRTNKG